MPEADFFTYCLDVEFNPIPQTTPYFDEWLSFISYGNEQKQKAITAFLFMVLINGYDWELFVEITGRGGTGKTTLAELAKSIAGVENVAILSLKTLDSEKDRVLLLNKNLAISADQPKYKGDGSTLKNITSGEPIEFNPKYKDPFSQVVEAVYLITNNEPIIFTEHNGGIDRRRVLFKFDRKPKVADRDLLNKLKSELLGIIQKLLSTHTEQTAITALNEQIRSMEALGVKIESDHLLDFAKAFKTLPPTSESKGLSLGNKNTPSTKVKTALYTAYLCYCELSGIDKPLNRTAFKRMFKQALATLGNESEYAERKSNGDYRTNVAYKDVESTLKEWEG